MALSAALLESGTRLRGLEEYPAVWYVNDHADGSSGALPTFDGEIDGEYEAFHV